MGIERDTESGLGIIEIVIGMFLLAIIAVAILPALWQGIRYSSEQSATATATRHLNSLVEEVREDPTCPTITAAAATHTFTQGSGSALSSAGTFTTCPGMSKTVTLTLTATDASSTTLATVTAIVYVP